MKRAIGYALLAIIPTLAVVLTYCGPGSNFNPPPNRACGSLEVTPDVRVFRDDAVALQRRPELDLDRVTIQYALIADGVDGFTESKPDLSLAEAEKLAADVYKQAKSGADFDKLVLTHSYGRLVHFQRPGTFTLLRGLGEDAKLPNPTTFRREQEEPSLSRAAWRLQPGEIGAVERHERDSNSGYYIVRRLTDAEIQQDNPADFDPTNESVKAMREAAQNLKARPEHGAARVTVQHILIGRYFSDGSGRLKRLSPVEAEELAAQVYAKAKVVDADFDGLVREFSYEEIRSNPPGAYLIVADKAEETPGQSWRGGMVSDFGDAAWRLEPGEVGVVLYHPDRSYFGWHIIKRIQ